MCVTSCCLAQAKWPQTFIRAHAPEWPVASIVSILISERYTPPAELSKTDIQIRAHVIETMSSINSSPHILNAGKPTVNSSPTSLNQRQVNICHHYGIWDEGCLSDPSQICRLVHITIIRWILSVLSCSRPKCGLWCAPSWGSGSPPWTSPSLSRPLCSGEVLTFLKKKISLMIKSLPGLPLFSLHLVGKQ